MTETTSYNTRLQLTQMQLGTLWNLVNSYGTTQNNGNVEYQELTITNVSTKRTNFKYDPLNRLAQAVEEPLANHPETACPANSSVWCMKYNYDAFGNRSIENRFGPGTGPGGWQ
jgi:hypothetical protein